MHHRPTTRRGYTLIELVLSSAISVLLLAGMASTLYVAGQALEPATSTATSTTADEALARLTDDLQFAMTVTERTPRTIAFTVPDRTGDGVPDAIRYAWSGTAGDPLTWQMNAEPVRTLVGRVESFDLTALTRLIYATPIAPGETLPMVLLVVADPTALTANEQARSELITKWGYDVQPIAAAARLEEFSSAIATASALYVPSSADVASLGSKLNDLPIGIVSEPYQISTQLGFSLINDYWADFESTMEVSNDTHPMMAGFRIGTMSVSTTPIDLASPVTPGPGVTSLTTSYDTPATMAMNKGVTRANLTSSPARRVVLPWYNSKLDISLLTAEAQQLLRQAIDWVAAGNEPGTVQLESSTLAKLGSNGTSLNLPQPAGTAKGDLLIAAVATDGNTSATITMPAGWNLVERGAYTTRVTSGVWWKLATGTEPATYTATWTGSEQAIGTVMRFTGHDPSSPIIGSASFVGLSSAPATAALDVKVDKSLILYLGGFDDGSVNVGDAGVPQCETIFMDKSSTALLQTVSGGAAYRIQSTAGSVNPSNFSLNANQEYCTIGVVIAPAPPEN